MANSALQSRYVALRSRPIGLPSVDDFEIRVMDLPAPGSDEVVVRNSFLSVDPYMRGMMTDRRSYARPYPLGEPMGGGAVGQVVESNAESLPVGAFVESSYGWREAFVAPAAGLKRVDPQDAPIQAFLGALGMPGLTAYAGLLDVATLKPGERVFISGAAGAVGSIACQIARNLGCYVVGSAGSDEKCAYLTGELGLAGAINYRTCGPLVAAVEAAFPDGIDVYFDNVGGSHLEAALNAMRFKGRIAACGMIENYNAVDPAPGPRNLGLIIGRCVTMRGFLEPVYAGLKDEFRRCAAAWVRSGQLTWRETTLDGLENAPAAFVGLFTGDNVGKMLVRL